MKYHVGYSLITWSNGGGTRTRKSTTVTAKDYNGAVSKVLKRTSGKAFNFTLKSETE